MIYAIAAVIVLILDQGLKYWTVSHIPLETGEVPLINGFIHLTQVHNYGAAFSILQNTRWLLVALMAAFTIAVIYALAAELIHTPLGRWSALFVMAGALGNGIDRMFVGYVVDMFELEFIAFPVFNVADIFVVVFGILFCVYIIIYKKPEDAIELQPEKRSFIKRIKSDASAPVDERRGGDIEMVRKASARRRGAQPQAQQEALPQQNLQPNPFDDAEPFSGERVHAAAKAERPGRDYISGETEPRRGRSTDTPAKKRTNVRDEAENMEFNIDDILAEFRDD